MIATLLPLVTAWGIVLPESLLSSQTFAVLSTVVAINTVMYGALALAKMLPKVYPRDWVTDRSRRAETRSIHPEGSGQGDDSQFRG